LGGTKKKGEHRGRKIPIWSAAQKEKMTTKKRENKLWEITNISIWGKAKGGILNKESDGQSMGGKNLGGNGEELFRQTLLSSYWV